MVVRCGLLLAEVVDDHLGRLVDRGRVPHIGGAGHSIVFDDERAHATLDGAGFQLNVVLDVGESEGPKCFIVGRPHAMILKNADLGKLSFHPIDDAIDVENGCAAITMGHRSGGRCDWFDGRLGNSQIDPHPPIGAAVGAMSPSAGSRRWKAGIELELKR